MGKIGADHKNLDTMVYRELKTMILERKLEPGSKIYQDRLARELGVSRTPLVNALKKLEHEKLVTAKPRRGYFVRLFTRAEVLHIFELREVLEGLAARRAAREISDAQIGRLRQFFEEFSDREDYQNLKRYASEDRNFHRYLISIGEREFLASILETYNVLTFSYQVDNEEGLVRPPGETIAEHRAIIEAICNRDEDQAESLTRNHLKATHKKLLEDFKAEQQHKKTQKKRRTA